MDQIVKNGVCILILPFLTGAAVRFLFRCGKRTHLLTAAPVVSGVIGPIA